VLANPTVLRAGTGEPLLTLARCMRDHAIGVLPVYDGDRLAGIISERDLVAALADGAAATAVAAAYMTPDPVTAAPDEDSAAVALRMVEVGVRHLPVVERGQVVGMVSARDLLMLGAWPGGAPPVAPLATQ